MAGTVTIDGHVYQLSRLVVAGGIFEFIGMVLEDLEHYFGDGPNPYDDQQHYPEGITVTVDPGSELEPIPLPVEVTIEFSAFHPEPL